jgi:hypothetical protein
MGDPGDGEGCVFGIEVEANIEYAAGSKRRREQTLARLIG